MCSSKTGELGCWRRPRVAAPCSATWMDGPKPSPVPCRPPSAGPIGMSGCITCFRTLGPRDGCDSDKPEPGALHRKTISACCFAKGGPASAHSRRRDRKSDVEGQSVSVHVDLGGRRALKKTNEQHNN